DGRFEHVERAIDQHLERKARLLGTLRDADGRLMEHDIDTGHRLGQHRPVADVALDDADLAAGHRGREVLAAPAHEVVQNPNLPDALVDQQVGDMRPDQAGPAGHQYARILHDCDSPRPARSGSNPSRQRTKRAGTPATIAKAGTSFVTTAPAPTMAP